MLKLKQWAQIADVSRIDNYSWLEPTSIGFESGFRKYY